MRQEGKKETKPKNDKNSKKSLADLTREVYGIKEEPGTKVWSDAFGNPAGDDDDHDREKEEFD